MLSMHGISKGFSGVKVLDAVDFEVRDGEVHALLGANGAGKSTLIKVLGGQYPDANGETLLDDSPVDISSPKAALHSGIGIVHQEFDLVPEMTVAENIYLGFETLSLKAGSALWRRIDRKAMVRAAGQLLKHYDLGVQPDAVIRKLPAGAQQIAEIARVIALGSRVMIFDEPTARLGQRDRDRLFEVFRTLRKSGKMIVFVTHYLDEVMAVADRASVMRDGRMMTTRDISETSVAELSRLMVGSDVKGATRRAESSFGERVLSVKGLSDGSTFEDVSLDVAAGEIVGLVGHLGSGRHELTRSILGLRPARGEVSVRATGGRNAKAGFVPENRRAEGIFPELGVGTNISLGFLRERSIFARLPRDRMRATGEEVVSRLQIKTEGISQKIGQLSGGNQQKAVFGREMVSNPSFYVIEAPTVGVDVKAAVELHNEIFKLADRGSAILLATDDLDEAMLMSDRVLVMLRGRIVRELDTRTLSREELISAMGAG
ncbi:MAG: sugar ABC transporter ATP-binding protein [Rhizobiaceae bacterium]|nr:sugar ABC transporter ATP-binding protein [Rhizobiaceae bacterium]